jgi:hypothetical protein
VIHEHDDMTPDDAQAWAQRRYKQLYKEFEEKHPTQLRANQFVSGLEDAARIPDGVDSTRADASASTRRPC